MSATAATGATATGDVTTAAFVLDEQLCFALHSASRAMTGCYRPLLAEVGVTYSQYAVLLVLWETPSVPLGELGRRLELDSGTLSPLLKRLEAGGLLRRERRSEDERTLQVTLTDAGAALRARAEAAQHQVVARTGLQPAELAALRGDLTALAARLRSVPGTEPG